MGRRVLSEIATMIFKTVRGTEFEVKIGHVYRVTKLLYLVPYVEVNRLAIHGIFVDVGETITILQKLDHEIFLYTREHQSPGTVNFEVLYCGKKYNLIWLGTHQRLELLV